METILKSNDQVYISWVKNILASHSISFFVIDEQMSMMEGSITAIPVRIVVYKIDFVKANNLIEKAKEGLQSI